MLINNKKADQAAKTLEGRSFLPLNIQFFAEPTDPSPVGLQPEPPNPPTNGGGNEPPKEPQGGTGDPTPPKENTYTQEDVNNIATKEARKAQEKIFKELGLDFENAKEGMKAFKEWSDSQKTEQEKLQERLQELETDRKSTSTENQFLKAQVAALGKGVKSESVEDVVALAERLVNDETTIDEAITQVVEKYPHFAQTQAEEPKKPSFSTGQHQKQQKTELDAWMEAFKK